MSRTPLTACRSGVVRLRLLILKSLWSVFACSSIDVARFTGEASTSNLDTRVTPSVCGAAVESDVEFSDGESQM